MNEVPKTPQQLNFEKMSILYNPLVTYSNITYKKVGERDLKLDVLMPKAKKFEKIPVIVYIHGGGWNKGFRCALMGGVKENIVYSLLEEGYAIISIDYTLTDENNTFPQNIIDSKDVVRWVRKNAKKYGFDPDNIGAWGGSAGAHLALMIGVTKDNDFLGADNLTSYSSKINYVIDENGPICMTMITKQIHADRVDEIVKHILGKEYSFDNIVEKDYDKMAEYFPNVYLDIQGIPTIITQGTDDVFVPHIHSVVLHEKLQNLGYHSELILLDGVKHGLGNTSEEDKIKICKKTVEFVKKYTV